MTDAPKITVEKRARAQCAGSKLLGHHMDHHGAGLTRCGIHQTVGSLAAARQPILAVGQRLQRVGTPLAECARIIGADRPGQFVEPTIKRLPRRREHGAVDQRRARLHRIDIQIAVRRGLARPAYRVAIDLGHHPINLGAELPARHRRPARGLDRQLAIHGGQRLSVDDQVGTKHDGAKQPKVDVTGLEDGGHLGQPFVHGTGVAQIAMAHRHARAQRGGDLGGHLVTGVGSPLVAVAVPCQSQPEELPDRDQAGRGGLGFNACRIGDAGEQERSIEHVFEYRTGLRH